MSRAAAIFDLDRTLLEGASWPVYHAALQREGVVGDQSPVALGMLFGLFRGLGETYLSMQATRYAVGRTRGWSIAGVDAAARAALPHLLAAVHPYARVLFEEHRQRGDVLVLATTTPQRLAAPLAEALGFDVCIATRYGEADGAFDGTIEGPFVWNRGKYRAVCDWAAANRVTLAASAAYSDSFFDAPLLEAVGRPTAVNPDPRLAVLAGLRGWPLRWLDKPPGVLKLFGRELQELGRPLLDPALLPMARFELSGLEHLPAGGFILCANHRSYFDPTAIAVLLAKAGRTCRFLGKKEVFDAPLIGTLARMMGGIRVDRGSGSDEPLAAAAHALAAGDVVAIMPQGTIPRGLAFFDPVLQGRWGAARLAGLTSAPVVPVGLWGTEAVWPRSSRLPRFDLLRPAPVSITVGAPMHVDGGADLQADTERIMLAITQLLPAEARRQHEPTDDELRATFPPGHRGDLRAPSDAVPRPDAPI